MKTFSLFMFSGLSLFVLGVASTITYQFFLPTGSWFLFLVCFVLTAGGIAALLHMFVVSGLELKVRSEYVVHPDQLKD